ncbi:uncharacterized protein I206_100498 [Kwoniella pini CBS 10737]|uniref:HIG1 domain-containing protein n=1 Tax=Kwoniella pini CBS 10737 TaxID=1296096 RepID=A0A1B9ICZ9_9TREE|nr:uncharacterized protein I206_00830 [Kwoniella pini CBS 10737]OCF53525.1 hypothetical protein I206_00830 [Kwoniella pini CBS 10737]
MSIPVQSSNKVSFTDFIVKKCKEQPFVPIGCLATVGALLGATYHLRKGNRNKFNQFLRLRVYAQGATVVALMIYGGVAFTNDQQQANYIRNRIALGEIPADTYYPGRRDVPRPPKESTIPFEFPTDPSPAPPKVQTDIPTSLPESLSTAVDAPPSLSKDNSTGTGGGYPLRKEERMKVSDFAKRLREAEQLHKEEEAVKSARK